MEDLHTYWKHKWVNPKIEIRESTIEGQGSFTTSLIKKGEVVSVNGGLVVPISEANKLRETLGSLRGLQISDDFLLTVSDPREAMFNHSCEPNLGLSGPIVIVAMRDIHPGEEVLFSYFFSDTNFKEFLCNCGSVYCRKLVKPSGWNDDIDF
jgi:SET domain-containing protein